MGAFDKWVSDANPAMPVGEVVRQALKLRLRNVVHYLPLAAFLADEDIEYVHAARVGTRRATAALGLFREFVPKKLRKRTKQTLKSIRDSMGEARDLDVYLDRFGKATEPGAATFLKRLKEQRQAAQRQVIDGAIPLLSHLKLRKLTEQVLRKVKRHANAEFQQQAFGDWAVLQLHEAWEEFIAEVPESEPTADELHQFRIATKRFRYAVELLNNGLQGSVRKVLYPQVKKLQGQLGEIQDHAVAAEKLAGWKQQATDPAEQAMLAQFEQDEREQYREKSEAFIHGWHRERINELRDAVEPLWQPPLPTKSA